MKVLRLSNIGKVGLNTDFAPWDLPIEAFNSGKNFRIFAGKIRTSGGSAILAKPTVSDNVGGLLYVRTRGNNYWAILGRNKWQAFAGSIWYDITPASFTPLAADQELVYSACSFGQYGIMSNENYFPCSWNITASTPALPLPWDATTSWEDIGYRCKVMVAYKNFLFAFNMFEGGLINEDKFRWSTASDTDALPFTWDPDDNSALAGSAQLGSDSGAIIDARTLRDSLIVYSQNAINVIDFVGDEFVFRRRTLTSAFGLFCKRALVEVKGMHYFLADGDIVRNDGNQVVSIAHDRIRSRMSKNVSGNYYDRSFAVSYESLKEVWFCVPEDYAEYPNVAYIYNWRDESWAIRDLPANLAHAQYGPAIISGTVIEVYAENPTPVAWDALGGSWDEQDWTWGGSVVSPPLPNEQEYTLEVKTEYNLEFGYRKNLYGTLIPSSLSGSIIEALKVDHPTDPYVQLKALDGLQIRDATIVNIVVNGETLPLVWDPLQFRYIGESLVMADYIRANLNNDILVTLILEDAVLPPSAPLTASGETLVGVDNSNGNLLIVDSSSSGEDVNTTITRTDMMFDGQDRVSTITRVYPHISGTEPVRITIGSQNYAGDAVRWQPAVTFNPDTDRKVDVRSTGSLHCWKVSSIGTGQWALSGMDFEYAPAGGR